MNKKLDFIGLENKILSGAQRYIPKFFEANNRCHFGIYKMVFCGTSYYYDMAKTKAIEFDEYTEKTALSIFGFIALNLRFNSSFKIPDDVKEAILTLHETDRKARVLSAEKTIFEWYKNTALRFNIPTSLHFYFKQLDYTSPYIKNACENPNVKDEKNEDEKNVITTHLLGSLYSKRFGDYTLENGQVARVGESLYNDNYWSMKKPAPNVDIREQKISNFLLFSNLCHVNGNTVSCDDWEVTFFGNYADLSVKSPVDDLEAKKIVLTAACAMDSKDDTFLNGVELRNNLNCAAYVCDKFYYKCVKDNPDSVIARDEIKIRVNTDFVEKNEEVTENDMSDIGMKITLTADGARNGEYDLNKMFGITFSKESPDRDFLKNVSITKQHLSLVNKIIQSVYRIKEREKKGITDLGQLIGADFINVNFIGEPGTGKSFGLKIVSAILGVPLYIETFSGDSDTDKFQGTNTISKGSPTFEWTSVPTVHKDGGFCALEEVNQMRPDKTMAMSQALVDPFLLKVDNTMDVYRSPYTFYINLFNVGTEGSKPFNEAYINRFGYTYDFCEDTEDIERRQLRLMLGYEVDNNDEVDEIIFTPRHLTDKDFNMAVALKNRVVDYLKGDTVARDEEAKTISKRQCKEFLVEIQNGLDPQTASIGTFVNTLKCVDRELAEEVKRNVIDVFPFDTYC